MILALFWYTAMNTGDACSHYICYILCAACCRLLCCSIQYVWDCISCYFLCHKAATDFFKTKSKHRQICDKTVLEICTRSRFFFYDNVRNVSEGATSHLYKRCRYSMNQCAFPHMSITLLLTT